MLQKPKVAVAPSVLKSEAAQAFLLLCVQDED